MRFAKLTSLGGLLISAENADYDTYKEILRCPNCGESVFLRASHHRKGAKIPASFVHYKAIPEVSICEARVGGYSTEQVEKSAAFARDQRLKKLKISLWKYLKHSTAIDLDKTPLFVNEIKKFPILKEMQIYGELLVTLNAALIVELSDKLGDELFNASSKLQIKSNKQAITTFLATRKRDWVLHQKIQKEALELFLTSPVLKEIRLRLLAVLVHYETFEAWVPILLDLDIATEEWKRHFINFLSEAICMTFLLTDWIAIWRD